MTTMICQHCGDQWERAHANQKYCAVCRAEKVREQDRKRYAANRKRILARSRAYRQANLEKARERDRKYKAANPEKIREYRERERLRRRGSAYYWANRDRQLARQNQYAKRIRELIEIGKQVLSETGVQLND